MGAPSIRPFDFAAADPAAVPDPPPPPEETLRRLFAPPELTSLQFRSRASLAQQLGTPITGLNIPIF